LAFTIVRVASGGLPVVESERGLPYYEADNGYGIPVTFGDSGIPLGGVTWYPAGSAIAYDFAAGRYFGPTSDTIATDGNGYLVTGSSRTNLMDYGGVLTNAAWNIANGLTTTGTGVTDPDGGITAFKINESAALGAHLIFAQSLTFTAGSALTAVFVLKAAERGFANLLVQDAGGNNFYLPVNLTTGAIDGLGVTGTGVFTSAATPVNLGNGWWQFSITGKVDAASTSAFVGVYLANSLDNVSYQGVLNSGINAWRMNLMQASSAGFSIYSQGLATTQQAASAPSWELYAADADSELRITGGVLTNVATSGQKAGYLTAKPNSSNRSRVGGKWTFTAGTSGTTGAAAFVIWQTDLLPGTVPNSGAHLSVGADSWSFGYIENANPVVVLGSGSFTAPASGIYQADIRVSGNTATIYLPDGSSTQITDPKIGSLAGPYACWEVFQGDAATDDKAGFTQAWAA
jgi:hypothetical protein